MRGNQKVTQLKAYRRQKRQDKARQQVEGRIVALGTMAAQKWTSTELLLKAINAHASVLRGINAHGQTRDLIDQSFSFMAAAIDYELQTRDGKGFDPLTLKTLGLKENDIVSTAETKLRAKAKAKAKAAAAVVASAGEGTPGPAHDDGGA